MKTLENGLLRSFKAVAAFRAVAYFKAVAAFRAVEDLRAVGSFRAVFGAFRADFRRASGAKREVVCHSQD